MESSGNPWVGACNDALAVFSLYISSSCKHTAWQPGSARSLGQFNGHAYPSVACVAAGQCMAILPACLITLRYGTQKTQAGRTNSSAKPCCLAAGGGGGGADKKAVEQQRKDAYRAELEAQIREKAERKAAEKRRVAAEEERREAAAAVDNPWGRAGGGGAPHRDPVTGQVGGRALLLPYFPSSSRIRGTAIPGQGRLPTWSAATHALSFLCRFSPPAWLRVRLRCFLPAAWCVTTNTHLY